MHVGKCSSIFLFIMLILSADICFAQVGTNHLVISQICIENAFGGGAYDEFVELYNPTSTDMDLAAMDFRIYRATASISANPVLLCAFNNNSHFNGAVAPASTIILSHGYYLVANEKGSANLLLMADAVVSSNRDSMAANNKIYLTKSGTPGNGTVDMVGFGGVSPYEGKGPAPAPLSCGSIMRKAIYSSTTTSMSNGGSDTNRASAFDSDNNAFDFVQLKRVRPRNSSVYHHPFFVPIGICLTMTDVSAKSISRSASNAPVFAFHYEETISHFKLTRIALKNLGTMATSEISNIRLYYDKNAKGAFDGSDVLIAPLAFNGINAWTNETLAITNNSDLLIGIGLSAAAVDGHTFKGCIPVYGIMIETCDKYCYAMTNIGIAVTNVPPPSPTGFICPETNAASAYFHWSAYPAIGDLSELVIYYGTNSTKMSNLLPIVSSLATNIIISSLLPNRSWYFRLSARDTSGLLSTNKSWIAIKTKSDANSPFFDDSSICSHVNNKVVHLQWTKAVDPENSYPIKYLIFVADTASSLSTRPVSYTVSTNKYSFSLPAGTSYIRIKARDSFSNTSTNSGYVAVTVVETTNIDNTYFYPNPAGKGDVLRFNNYTDAAVFIVYNIKGEKILETHEKSFIMPESASAGIYYIVIRDGSKKKRKILIYQK